MQASESAPASIRAAGAVVLRTGDHGTEVLVVHRPHHGDWSLPKGKLEPGEPADVAAVREVREETGVTIRLGPRLDDVHYTVDSDGSAREKVVHWWVGVPVVDDADAREADGEVDEVVWLTPAKARQRLTYPADRALVDAADRVPATTPLIVLRHAEARKRADWDGPDDARPLSATGLEEAHAMTPRLAARGVRRIVSSSSWRCVATVLELASANALTIERDALLTEPRGEEHPQMVRAACDQWLRQVTRTGEPTVFCGHRPVLPDMLAGFGLPGHAFATAEAFVAHVTTEGAVAGVEHLTPAPSRRAQPSTRNRSIDCRAAGSRSARRLFGIDA